MITIEKNRLSNQIKSKIRTVPDFPKKGIMFRDITTLLQDPEGLQLVIDDFYQRYKDKGIDIVAGIESRGFILGAALAYKLGAGFVLLRKPKKLPFDVESVEYDLEYGKDKIEVHTDAIKKGQRVLLVDDLVATGGTLEAGTRLVKKLDGTLVECACVIDLPDLGGSKRLEQQGYKVYHQVAFEGD